PFDTVPVAAALTITVVLFVTAVIVAWKAAPPAPTPDTQICLPTSVETNGPSGHTTVVLEGVVLQPSGGLYASPYAPKYWAVRAGMLLNTAAVLGSFVLLSPAGAVAPEVPF